MSKMKQHLEKQVVITYSSEESTGWRRFISFDYEGNKYDITLYWSEFDGYDITWRYCNDEKYYKTPEWAVNWDESAHNDMSFEHYLDDLTWEMDK